VPVAAHFDILPAASLDAIITRPAVEDRVCAHAACHLNVIVAAERRDHDASARGERERAEDAGVNLNTYSAAVADGIDHDVTLAAVATDQVGPAAGGRGRGLGEGVVGRGGGRRIRR